MPSLVSGPFFVSSETGGPSQDSRVLIGYAGCLGGSHALLFYSYEWNYFYISWQLNDTTCVSDCLKAEGSANYYVWLRIKDSTNTTIVDEKWVGFDLYYSWGLKYINCTAECGKTAAQIQWPLTWEFIALAAGTNKSGFWDKVHDFVDVVGTVLTIVAIAILVATAMASVYFTAGATTSIAAAIATEAIILAIKISLELFKDHLMSQLQYEVIEWLESLGWDPGDEESWSIILLGAYSPEMKMSSEATLQLTGPSVVRDTYDPTENTNGPYEVKQYRVQCKASRFNWISLNFKTASKINSYSLVGAPTNMLYCWVTHGTYDLTYWWDAGLECARASPSSSLEYFWHDENCTPCWNFGFIVDVDPERDEDPPERIHQEFNATIEMYGLDYYKTGNPQIILEEMSVGVDFDYTTMPYSLWTEIDISEPGQYMLVINSSAIYGKPIYISIMAFTEETFPRYMVENIPNINDQENVIVIVPRMANTSSPIILKNGPLSPTTNITTINENHPFLLYPLPWHVQINLFGETGNIVIKRGVLESAIERLSIEFSYLDRYAVILPMKPIPVGGVALFVNYPYNAVFIKTHIYYPWTDITISVAQTPKARNTYIWIPEGNVVSLKLLKNWTITPPTITEYHSLGLYANVSTNEVNVQMDAGWSVEDPPPPIIHPFAWGTLSEPTSTPTSASLNDTGTENFHNLTVRADSDAPFFNLSDFVIPAMLYRVQLTPNWFKGDVNRDYIVDITDIYLIARAFGAERGTNGYEYHLDIEPDGIIDISDIYLAALEFGKWIWDQQRQFPPELS